MMSSENSSSREHVASGLTEFKWGAFHVGLSLFHFHLLHIMQEINGMSRVSTYAWILLIDRVNLQEQDHRNPGWVSHNYSAKARLMIRLFER